MSRMNLIILFVLMLYISNFSGMSGHLQGFLGWTSTKRIICLAKRHNTEPVVSLKLVTIQSHSTIEFLKINRKYY